MGRLNEYLEAAKTGKRRFKTSGDLIKFLLGTLIPDLRESGKDATADDFVQALKYMRFPDKGTPRFINYLTNTLIPDLKESGHDATAEGFEEAVYWIKEQMKRGK